MTSRQWRRCEDVITMIRAMKDAGCRNWEMIEHRRSPHPHVRGCWVVGLSLGKS